MPADLATLAAPPDAPGALWLPSSHFWPDANTPRYVIVHGTGYSLSQSAADVAHDFATTNPNSTHYAVDRAGNVAQMVREKDAAWGNGVITAGADVWWSDNPNRYTISIEHVNDAQNATPLSDAQKAASFALIADICSRWGINAGPAQADMGITGHYSIDPVNRSHCPGAYPWQELWAYLLTHSLRRLPFAVGMSEFQGYNGDCTQTAHLACLHTIDPHRWPADRATLDALVQRDIAAGLAGASGSQDAAGLAASLRTDGVPFHQTLIGNWADELNTYGGIRPIVLQLASAGGNLPGDETGVQGHAIACLAWNVSHQAGLFCDGDNQNSTSLVRYTMAELQAAAPFALTVIDIAPRGQGASPVSTPLPHPLGAGFAAYVAGANVTGTPVSGGEIKTGDPRYPGESFATFGPDPAHPVGLVLYYTDAMGVADNRAAWLVPQLFAVSQQHAADAAAAQAEVAKLTADNAALTQQVADLTAQLKAAQNTPPAAPTASPADAAASAAVKALASALALLSASQSNPAPAPVA